MSSISEWEALCAAYLKANDEERATWLTIEVKYDAIVTGVNTESPSDHELDSHLRSRQALNDVRQQMDAFIADFLSER